MNRLFQVLNGALVILSQCLIVKMRLILPFDEVHLHLLGWTNRDWCLIDVELGTWGAFDKSMVHSVNLLDRCFRFSR